MAFFSLLPHIFLVKLPVSTNSTGLDGPDRLRRPGPHLIDIEGEEAAVRYRIRPSTIVIRTAPPFAAYTRLETAEWQGVMEGVSRSTRTRSA